ncbi:MAG: FtsH protease activity modulator HflK [Oleiphilaceae bacterium]|nr:FtsH protease activity modulator HflK [Oleiphilus sp. HI0125]KZZ58088.1 protease modulator HflK [Oleiphilus sp. HI0125]MCH2159150.1 FtsH protease activity modulator HflK [Oleiphilaceae bacterium]
MAWNEPGNSNGKDPWGNNNRGGNQGPPDLDQALKQLMDKLNGLFGGSGNGNGGSDNNGGKQGFGGIALVGLVVFVLFLGWKSIYTIDEQQRGVVLFLGEYSRTLDPGLRIVIPLVEQVIPVNVTNVRNAELKEEMLTQDENVVAIELNVQYTVRDPVSFALRVEDPERSLQHAVESALRHEVGSTNLDPILTEGRGILADSTRERLQDYMDNYQTGINVSVVNIKEARAPQAVQAAFDDVQKAKLDKERFVNEAEAYKNTVIPEARGKAQRMLQEASAYRDQVVAKAQGEADRFKALLVEYNKAPEVTRERLYIDAISDVYGNSSKVLIDVEGGNNMMYLPLDKIISERSNSAPSSVRSDASSSDISAIADQVIEEIRSRNSRSSAREVR